MLPSTTTSTIAKEYLIHFLSYYQMVASLVIVGVAGALIIGAAIIGCYYWTRRRLEKQVWGVVLAQYSPVGTREY
jgi:uncharacterized iron-regulated membrane protein